MRLDVDTLMTRYGYSREAAEQEVKRATCEHDYGTMCVSSPLVPFSNGPAGCVSAGRAS